MRAVALQVAILTVLCCGRLYGQAPAAAVDKPYVACENRAGSGFYWVETTTGRTWWLDPGKMAWVFCGLPEGGLPGPIGTYQPYPNLTGGGVFVLNTTTGEGWWTNGKEWKKLGRPRLDRPPA